MRLIKFNLGLLLALLARTLDIVDASELYCTKYLVI